ncbi:MAG: SiaB family protein kinase, partial [Flavobacteriales bacterium]|nr:SiaB family protein kinase [Flavobacteriales bacterium]
MELKSLDFLFRHFAEEQMHFLYTGEFSDEHTDDFIELNNQQYNAAEEFKKSQRKAGFLIAECFQNIVRHNDPSHKDSYFHVKNNNGLFTIISGNTVKNEIIPSLKKQLEQLNRLTSEELKETYRKILVNGEMSSKGGAGLGLIEMARRSKNKLNFAFTEIDSNKSYFYFRLHFNM